jgi:alpha-D-ribose 1-methylphosphonate 5-triphosphate synthase subunit PhnG
MEKRRLFRILTKADANTVAELAADLTEKYRVLIIEEPNKALAMIKMREPVKNSLFYIGEVIITQAVVELENTKGIAVTMGDNCEKTLNMAVIDAACNHGVFTEEAKLLELEKIQNEYDMKVNALHLKTKVNFNSMDSGMV